MRKSRWGFGGLSRVFAARLSLFVIVGTLSAAPLIGQEVSAEVTPDDETLSVRLHLTDYDGEEIVSTLSEGMRSEVSFLVRLYRTNDALFGIFGDRLVHEYRVVHEASRDVFRRAYRIETRIRGDEATVTRDETRYFESRERFLQELSQIRSLRLNVPPEEDAYLLVQARVTPVRLVPALGLLSFFMSSEQVETSWNRVPISSGSAMHE